ncbi:MAG: hypothetical protein AB7E79_02945 [Rhodospirillaceae bacterium]
MVAASAVYYALYFDAGFNYSDEGNYVQFAYELSRGTSLRELPVNYGLLWFKVGEALFRGFGPHLLLARALFFACALLTTLLVYAAVLALTGRRWFAAAFAAVPGLAPAFLPTAFYGLCILINAVPQIRLAQRLREARPRDAALAAVALAISFQIRPDFGYIFAVPLAVLLLLAAWQSGADRAARLSHGRRLILAAACAFLVAHIPGLLLALGDGYFHILVGQYLSYPIMLADYGLRGLGALFGGATSDTSSAALLQRPRLFGADSAAELRLALLVYLPLVIIGAFVICAALGLRKGEDRIKYAAVTLVVLVTGAAALPHYLFYRPDLSHIANFMPGFTVLAGVLFARTLMPGRAVLVVPAMIAATLGLYVWTALTTEGTGSIAGSFGRTESFVAAHGVDVRLSPAEKAMLEDIKTVIEGNSAPGDAIVCVPYCPGIAFMTGRRLLFREHYVDDSVLVRDPGWIPRAIALTEERRPPVVIVMDWAINGTDISRFSRWAAPYMETLENLARQKLERPGLTIFLL